MSPVIFSPFHDISSNDVLKMAKNVEHEELDCYFCAKSVQMISNPVQAESYGYGY